MLLVDLPDDALFEMVSDGQPLTIKRAPGTAGGQHGRGGALPGRACSRAGSCWTCSGSARRPRRAGARSREALERFAHNTIEHMREERELLTGPDRAAALRHRLPRPSHAGGRPRRRPPARPPCPAPVRTRHASRDRGGRRRRRGAARRGPRAGHDRRRHGLGGRAGAALRRRARRALLPRRPGAREPTA